jgi:benzylsuccinate synthase
MSLRRAETMASCIECTFFFPVPEGSDDYEAGKGDCVNEKEDEKGKYWLSKVVTEETEQCSVFQKR